MEGPDAEILQSIINAKTSLEIDQTLRDAITKIKKTKEHNGNNQSSDIDGQHHGISQNRTHSHLDIDPSSSLSHSSDLETTLTLDDNDDDDTELLIAELSQYFNLNVAGSALRRMAHISIQETRRRSNGDSEEDPITRDLRKNLLTSLLQTIGEQVVEAHKQQQGRGSFPNENTSPLCINGLSDILLALAVLTNEDTIKNMQPLAKLVVELMERHNPQDIHKQLGPVKLLQCFSSIARLQLLDDNNDETDEDQDSQRQSLQSIIYSRLLKPDAVSRLTSEKMSHGLSALAHIKSSTDQHSGLLARSFMRRLRKPKVRDDEATTIQDLCRALVACDTLLSNNCMIGYEDEASMFGFSTLRAIVDKSEIQSHKFTPTEMSNILSAWATLSTGEREDTVIVDLLSICDKQRILDDCNLVQLERIVSSIEKLHVTSSAGTIKAAGHRLETLVNDEQRYSEFLPDDSSSYKKINPRIVNQILRCPVLLHRRDAFVMEPYLAASSKLFVDEKFLEQCKVSELANFLWFMSISNSNDYEALTALVRRLLDPSLVDKCSPKLASRILGTYTSIISTSTSAMTSYDSDTSLPFCGLQMTSNLFREYGGHLLTTQLTPAEVSTSLYAYAKVSYVEDMGIYDHLVSLIVSMADKCTSRQLTQSLWSCGKVIGFESPDFGADSPPYFHNAYNIAKVLSSRNNNDKEKRHRLSHVDITQCIWALGRLGINDDVVVRPFLEETENHVDALNAIEISNILWGLSRIGFNDHNEGNQDRCEADSALILALSHRLATDATLHTTPKAASTALYALGRLQLRDKQIFNQLSEIIISQIDNTSAQAVANALWAHKKVQLRPPKEMLNLWAIQKLGLSGLNFQNPNQSDE